MIFHHFKLVYTGLKSCGKSASHLLVGACRKFKTHRRRRREREKERERAWLRSLTRCATPRGRRNQERSWSLAKLLELDAVSDDKEKPSQSEPHPLSASDASCALLGPAFVQALCDTSSCRTRAHVHPSDRTFCKDASLP